MKIPLVDLRAQYANLRPEIDAAIAAVLESTAFVKGPAVGEFETAFASYCEARHAIGVGNGTDALRLVFRALGFEPGDEMLTVPTTFIATTEAISHVGAVTRFVDIDERTWMFDVEKAAGHVTDRTRAIVPVHLYGHPVDMDAVNAFASQRHLAVVEDAAQAHGARLRGRRVGALAQAGTFSFYPGKNLGAYGDAGAVVTNDDDVAERVRMYADHGRLDKYEHRTEGWNSRLDTIQAAVLAVKLRSLDDANAERRRCAQRYNDALGGIDALEFPVLVDGAEPVHHLYVVRAQNRDALRKHLGDQEIATGVHYPLPLHLQPAYRHLGYARGDFPVAEALADSIVSLPCYPELGDTDIDRVVDAVRSFYDAP
ncbi:MAG: Glutamine--scyllo-inositol transaminase [Actinomycetia bacterium]|nr:Glutamine--scyllo-inositol transaminase [Actinomycetes bacterium]